MAEKGRETRQLTRLKNIGNGFEKDPNGMTREEGEEEREREFS